MNPPLDQMQRPLRDLRISVTDRCNFRCHYCMPADVFGDGYHFLPKPEILTFEEITQLARVFSELGVEKFRLTGGEPLLRRSLPDLIAMLVKIPGERDIAMTSNGTLLSRYAKKLKAAGLQRVTVSLDALKSDVFARMNGVGASSKRVIEGIDAALEAGLGVKINSVIQRGVNEGEVLPLAEFARARGVTLRFIEFMDTGNTNDWKLKQVVATGEIVTVLENKFGLISLDKCHLGDTAQRYAYQDEPAIEVGFISSVSQPFCSDCNRARLSADGRIFTCLFAAKGYDVRTMLRNGASDDDLLDVFTSIWKARDDRYSELRAQITHPVVKPEMSYLGG